MYASLQKGFEKVKGKSRIKNTIALSAQLLPARALQ